MESGSQPLESIGDLGGKAEALRRLKQKNLEMQNIFFFFQLYWCKTAM